MGDAVAPNLQKFCRAIALAKLMNPADLEKEYRAWRTDEPEQRENLQSFARFLIKTKRCTETQLNQFLREPAAEVPLPPPEQFDVELIAIRDPSRKLDRRDLLVFVAGFALASVVFVPLFFIFKK